MYMITSFFSNFYFSQIISKFSIFDLPFSFKALKPKHNGYHFLSFIKYPRNSQAESDITVPKRSCIPAQYKMPVVEIAMEKEAVMDKLLIFLSHYDKICRSDRNKFSFITKWMQDFILLF